MREGIVKTEYSLGELGRFGRKMFAELSEEYPGSKIYLAGGIADRCKTAPYSPPDLYKGFTADEVKLEKLAEAINRRHAGSRGQDGKRIPIVTAYRLRVVAGEIFETAGIMMRLSSEQLNDFLGGYNPADRALSEKLGMTKLRELGV